MVISVTQAFLLETIRLLPKGIYDHKDESQNKERAVCDYVASMTDAHLVRTYERLFSPRIESVFDGL